MSRLRRYLALPPSRRMLLLWAAWWLGVARLALLLLPFRRLVRWLARAEDDAGAAMASEPIALCISWAVTVAARHVPWRSDCFPQAIAAMIMLRRRGVSSRLHIGVTKGGRNGLHGHAWLCCGSVVVTGDGDLEHFSELYTVP